MIEGNGLDWSRLKLNPVPLLGKNVEVIQFATDLVVNTF